MGEARLQDLLFEVYCNCSSHGSTPRAYSLAHTYFFCGKHVAFILDDLLGSGLPK
jgi:hypothetical protein